MRKRNTTLVLLSLLMLTLLSACGMTSQNEPGEPVTVRVAVLPIMDTLPMHVAEQEGLFAQRNLNVEFIPVASAPERDQVVASGNADALINEVIAAVLFNRDEVQLQVVRIARAATNNYPVFSILASADSGIESVEDLKGVEIGISQGTLIEYITERLLSAEGFSAEEIKTVAVPSIPDRMTMLTSGDLKAAMLPDPLTDLAVQNGAKVIIDDSSHPEYGYSVLSMTKAFIDAHPQAVRDFLAAYEEAVQMINNNPEKYTTLLTEKNLVPPPVMGNYTIKPYPEASVPTRAQWDDVIAWMVEKGLTDGNVSYSDTITAEYLP